MSKRKTPILRFKGFNNAWEQRKLGDIAKIVGGGTPSTKNSQYWNGNINWYSPTEIGKNAFVNESKKKITKAGLQHSSAKLLPKNKTILFTSRANIGDLAIMTSDGATNQGFQSWVIDQLKIDIYFLYSLGNILKNQAIKLAYGSTFLEISNKNVKNLQLKIPNIQEQKKIGSLFKIIDELLTLQERKYEELKLLKKALMQNMFANKSLYPKLRFKGFTDKWKQGKLNSIASLLNGRAYKRNELLNSGKYPVLRVGNFYTNDKWYFSNLELKTNKYAIKGDLLYTWSATFGPHIWTGKKVIYHYHIWKIILKNNVDKFFVYEFLKEDRDQLLRNTNGSTMIHITKSNMENKYISLPNKKGQKKIGNFFKKFDNLIIAQNKKYNELKFIKKFLLQNMFI